MLAERELIELLIARAIAGGTVEGLARVLACDSETVRRRLAHVGLKPKHLMAQVRLRAYDLMVERGGMPPRALAACGWANPKAREKARSRLLKRVGKPA